MPRSITPCSVRMTNGTVAPRDGRRRRRRPGARPDRRAASSARRSSGTTTSSSVGASQSASVGGTETRGLRRAHPRFEVRPREHRTVLRVARHRRACTGSSPAVASSVFSPSARPVTRPRRTSPSAANTSVTSVAVRCVTTASAAASPESDHEDVAVAHVRRHASRSSRARANRSPPCATRCATPSSTGARCRSASPSPSPARRRRPTDELHAAAASTSAAPPPSDEPEPGTRHVTDRRVPSRSPRTPRGRPG